MNEPEAILPLVAIVGPTASGKSALGVWLAEHRAGEVVACDSTQLYRGFDIGTAKPDESRRRGIPHHLLDVLEPDEVTTAGGYREMAIGILARLRASGRLPIFTVGTGLYLRALLEGLADSPRRSEQLRERLRTSAREHRAGHLHRILKRMDPESAGRVALGDEQKLIRAIEVCLLTRKPISELHRSGRQPLQGWHPIKIGLLPPREALYDRIHARTDEMIERGWLREVQELADKGMAETAKPFDFIGYREVLAVLRGQLKMEQARAAIQQATRRYAKRQMTWFRKESQVRWFEGFGDDSDLQRRALDWTQSQLAETSRRGAGTGI
jgi:tRNA dimethylallyltransferase